MPDPHNATLGANFPQPNATAAPAWSPMPPAEWTPAPTPSSPPITPDNTDPVVFAYPNASTSWTLERRHAHVTLSRALDTTANLYLANRNHSDTARPYLALLASAVAPGTTRVRFRTRNIAGVPPGGAYVVFFADASAVAGFEEVLVTSDPFAVLPRDAAPPAAAANMQDSGARGSTSPCVPALAAMFGVGGVLWAVWW
ncbi:hypothetical protein Q8F55_006603 [Vanrija albida]|uniref:Galactose oxidase-like Early set domain-containing protein n=1 Tax=Vanrija albida TaxID=181172 RepID=A0ABR3PXL4_9TREE